MPFKPLRSQLFWLRERLPFLGAGNADRDAVTLKKLVGMPPIS
jgi:hypothetical protein